MSGKKIRKINLKEQKQENMNDDQASEIEVDIDDLRKKKLFIATPMYGGQCYGTYAKSFMAVSNVFNQYQLHLQWETLNNESLITRARNYMVDMFLRSECTHMLFIDADIEFDATSVLQLLALCDEGTDKDIVCGTYPKKNISWEKVAKAVEKGIHLKDPNLLERFAGDMVFSPLKSGHINLQKPVEILENGTGFMMIKRSVFTRFANAHPELLYRPDHKRTKDFDGGRQLTAFFQDPLEHTGEYYKAYAELKTEIDGLADDEVVVAKKLKNIVQKYEDIIAGMERRHLSEDYYFCQEARKLGMKVWLCPWMMLNHTGTYKFIGDIFALSSIRASTSVDEKLIKKI